MTEQLCWRVINSGESAGSSNMAIDEALLRSFDPASSSPVLRLYGWNPPALSLGRFQKAADVLNTESCRADSLTVVRRITGGGVIYHADELTYSLVCAPEQIPSASSIKDSFRVLTGFLLAFYRQRGLDAIYAADAPSEGTTLGGRTAFCYAGRESFDILVNGRKIGGNAQRRLKGVIFQHGSIPLLNRSAAGLSYMLEQLPEYAAGTISLAECGIHAGRENLQAEIATVFGSCFGVQLKDDVLTEVETGYMEKLLLEKYNTDQWNLHGVEM